MRGVALQGDPEPGVYLCSLCLPLSDPGNLQTAKTGLPPPPTRGGLIGRDESEVAAVTPALWCKNGVRAVLFSNSATSAGAWRTWVACRALFPRRYHSVSPAAKETLPLRVLVAARCDHSGPCRRGPEVAGTAGASSRFWHRETPM